MDRRVAIIISCSLMALTCLLFIVSNALPMWGTSGVSSFGGTAGLWQLCLSFLGVQECNSFSCDDAPHGFSFNCATVISARACMTLACIISAIGVLSLFLCLLRGTNPNPSYIRAIKRIPFGSLPLAIIGTATGIAFVTGQSLTISVAAILAIIGIIANVAAAVMAVMIPVDYY